jgi:hypothetical protein
MSESLAESEQAYEELCAALGVSPDDHGKALERAVRQTPSLYRQKPLHAIVQWKYRCTPQEEEFAVYRNGSWEVEVCDQDGDLAYWSVSFKNEVLAKGEVTNTFGTRCDLDIAMDTALACLYAIQTQRGEDDH